MTEENKKIFTRICEYAEKVLGEIDPQKTPVSAQLEALKPVMKEIAEERRMSMEDVFILYMDLASEAGAAAESKLQTEFEEGGTGSFSSTANTLL